MLAVDLFAGAGGSSTGAQAAGAKVVWAANHWRVAVDAHKANHPKVEHVCQDLNLFPSCEIPDHDILLASPSCKGFSPARGKHQKHHDKHRATAWIVVDALEAKRPPFAVIENVPEMRRWRLYPAWKQALGILGYSIAEHILDAADFGVPQHRRRLFVVATRTLYPLSLQLPVRPHVPVASFLEWSQGAWSPIQGTATRPRASKTLQRIEQARRDGLGPRFLMPYYSSGSGRTGRCTDLPIGTLTTRARWALVDLERNVMRMLSVREARACMGFPSSYILPRRVQDANAALGNAVCPPVMQAIVEAIQLQG